MTSTDASLALVTETLAAQIAQAKKAERAARREARSNYICEWVKDIAPRGEIAIAECPCCGIEEVGESAIEDTFGVRRMKNFNDKKHTFTLTIRVQSYCRKCRSKKAGAAAAAKAAA